MPQKVLLIIIDALASAVVRPAMEQGRLPTLQKIVDAGWVRWDSTSIFPSITPAATAALITGGYPRSTGITGACFYDRAEERLNYYGDDIWPVMRKGFGRFFSELLVKLNRDRLKCSTIFERVEASGHSTACLNYIWYRGSHRHKVYVPWTLRIWPEVPSSPEVFGPRFLALGDFVSSFRSDNQSRHGGMFKRYGFNDESTTDSLLSLAAYEGLPKLTVAYFPDNDFASHAEGPGDALATLEKVDRQLREVFQFWGGIENMCQEVAVVVTGDHSQCELVHDQEQRSVRLDQLLSGFHLATSGTDWRPEEEVLICLNMRAAQIYCRPSAWRRRDEMAAALLADRRMDQVILEERHERIAEPIYRVVTTDRSSVRFCAGAGLTHTAHDEYENRWSWDGDLAAVDAQVGEDGCLKYGDYPNALERIRSSFDGNVSGDIWVTCRPGYEFQLQDTSVHRRGSHGSLHAVDSQSPLIAAGIPEIAYTPRSVDIAHICLAAIGLPAQLPCADTPDGSADEGSGANRDSEMAKLPPQP